MVAEAMKTVKPGSRRWKQLQAELDRLCGTEEKPRDIIAEETYERTRRGT